VTAEVNVGLANIAATTPPATASETTIGFESATRQVVQ
jgi:hypothetical protein